MAENVQIVLLRIRKIHEFKFFSCLCKNALICYSAMYPYGLFDSSKNHLLTLN